jgi:hypothetical protein
MSLERSGGLTTSDHITTVCHMEARMSDAHPLVLWYVDVSEIVSEKMIKDTDSFGVMWRAMRYAHGWRLIGNRAVAQAYRAR